jgi:hypothetical protein
MQALAFNTKFDATTGAAIELAPGVTRISAPNASPYTFTGTNSFLLGQDRLALVDPGPEDDAHYQALEQAIGGRQVCALLAGATWCAAVVQRAASAVAPLAKV